MSFLEKDLEEIIYCTSEERLNLAGLEIRGKKFRQLKIGNYGRADIVTVSKDYEIEFEYINHTEKLANPYLNITVYELKKDNIGVAAFLQAIGYCKGIKSYLEKRGFDRFNLSICLIGKTIDLTGSLCYITDLIYKPSDSYIDGYLTSCDFYTYKYTIDGLEFEQRSDYKLKDEGF